MASPIWDNFFDTWKNEEQIKNFCEDGIINEEIYNRQTRRVLFILRDVNYGKDCDLRADLSNAASLDGKTYNNVARWTIALLDHSGAYPANMPGTARVEQMQRVAVMNIKKGSGGPNANGDELLDAIDRDSEKIREEIVMCKPSIIIACGIGDPNTYNLLTEYVLPDTNRSEKQLIGSIRSWRYHLCEVGSNTIPLVEFCHPNLRGTYNQKIEGLYYDMLSIRNELLK